MGDATDCYRCKNVERLSRENVRLIEDNAALVRNIELHDKDAHAEIESLKAELAAVRRQLLFAAGKPFEQVSEIASLALDVAAMPEEGWTGEESKAAKLADIAKKALAALVAKDS